MFDRVLLTSVWILAPTAILTAALIELSDKIELGYKGHFGLAAMFLGLAVLTFGCHLRLKKARDTSELTTRSDSPESDRPRWWEVAKYCLPRKVRAEIYDNLIDEVQIDWLEFCGKCGCPVRRRVMRVVLSFRVVWYLASTIFVASTKGLLGVLREYFWPDLFR